MGRQSTLHALALLEALGLNAALRKTELPQRVKRKRPAGAGLFSN